jgi:hypothetical protein
LTVPPAVYPAPLAGETAAVRITDCPGVADAGAMLNARLVVNIVPARLATVGELEAEFESGNGAMESRHLGETPTNDAC